MRWTRPHPDVFNVLLQVLDDGCLTDGQGHGQLQEHGCDPHFQPGLAPHPRRQPRPHQDRGGETTRVGRAARVPPRVSQPVGRVCALRAAAEGGAGDRSSSCKSKRSRSGSHRRGSACSCRRRRWTRWSIWGTRPSMRARPLKRVVQKELETALARGILGGDYGEGDTVMVDPDSRTAKLVLRAKAGRPRKWRRTATSRRVGCRGRGV